MTIEQNRATVTAFYDLMFNQNRPAESRPSRRTAPSPATTSAAADESSEEGAGSEFIIRLPAAG